MEVNLTWAVYKLFILKKLKKTEEPHLSSNPCLTVKEKRKKREIEWSILQILKFIAMKPRTIEW